MSLFNNVDCVRLYVDNLDDGISFYKDKLGLKLLWKTDNACGLSMDNDITEVVLTTDKEEVIDFKVDDVNVALNKYLQAGGKLVYGPFDIDIGKCVVVKDKWENTYCLLDMSKGTYDVNKDGSVKGVSKK